MFQVITHISLCNDDWCLFVWLWGHPWLARRNWHSYIFKLCMIARATELYIGNQNLQIVLLILFCPDQVETLHVSACYLHIHNNIWYYTQWHIVYLKYIWLIPWWTLQKLDLCHILLLQITLDAFPAFAKSFVKCWRLWWWYPPSFYLFLLIDTATLNNLDVTKHFKNQT